MQIKVVPLGAGQGVCVREYLHGRQSWVFSACSASPCVCTFGCANPMRQDYSRILRARPKSHADPCIAPDVGRSCVLATINGRNIMFDCGMHMGYNDMRRFPDFSYISKACAPCSRSGP